MQRLDLRLTWNPMTDSWLVRSGSVTIFSTDLIINRSGFGSLIIFQGDEPEPTTGLPVYYIREVDHPSLYSQRPGYRPIFSGAEVQGRSIVVDVDVYN